MASDRSGERVACDVAQVGNFLLQHKQEGQKENVDLHSLSAKEARAAVLCILCNIQVCQAFPLHAAQISTEDCLMWH